MRRPSLYISCGIAALLLLVAGAAYWLVATTEGARFALTRLPAAAGVEVSVGEVRGRLLDRLHLAGLRARRGKVQAQVDLLDLYWDPRQLWSGELAIHELSLSGVRVQDDTQPTGKPVQLRWPRVSAAVSRFSAHVSRLKVSGVSYRRLKAPPVVVSELSSSLAFEKGILSLPDLRLFMPQGRASGELVLGFWRPLLRMDIAAVPARPLQGIDLFSLQARLLAGRYPEQLTGAVAAAAKSRGKQRLEVTGQLDMTLDSFNLRRLTVLRPGRRGTVTGDASMTFTTGAPVYEASLKLKDLDLAAELKRPALISGTATVSGSVASYIGNFALSNSGPGWQSASLAAGFRGGTAGVKLAPISGRLLDGTVGGALDVNWSNGLRVRGTLTGRKLNPAKLAAQWPGVVNVDLAGNLEMPKKGAPRGSVRGKLLESRLHGQSLTGDVDAAFAGKSLRVNRLVLAGRGFRLRAAGEVDQRVNFAARVSDLSRLVPRSRGQLDADGWVRWRDGVFSGSVSGRGANVAAAGLRAATVQLRAGLGEGKDYPVHVDATVTKIAVGRLQVETALVALQGTAARHRLDAELHSPKVELHATLAGGYRSGVWRGELARLSGRDSVGPFALAAPTPVTFSSSGGSIAPLAINGLPGERVEVAGELKRHPTSGTLRGAWSGLNLARANDWLEGTRVSGGSSGSFDLRLLPGERLVVTARAEASGTVVTDGRRVSLQRVSCTVEGGRQGLRAALDLWLEGGAGEAHATFSSNTPASLSLPREGDLDVQLSNFDLALLRPVTPSKLAVDGRLAGIVRGKLLPGRRLELRGNAALEKGHLAWRAEDQAFDASIDTADVAVNWQGSTAAGKAAEGRLQLTVRAAATGAYTANGQRIALSRCELRVDADEHGSRATIDASLDRGGTLRAALSSSSPAGLRVPETGDFDFEWGGIDAALLRPFLPAGVNVEGEFAGQGKGRLLPGKRLEMAGEAVFSQGRAKWQGQGGEVKANLRSATLAFDWRGETLSATLDLALAEYGQAAGRLVLPLPARLPVAADPNGAVQGYLSGKVQEKGFLTTFLPGLVQESHGVLDLDLRLSGIWSDPRLAGTVQLSNAGAYLPTAGITLSDVQFLATLQGDQVRVENLRAVSGAGHVDGTLLVRLQGWRITGYSGTLSGDRFQTVFLPELQMVTSPRLSFQGDLQAVTLRGEVRIPEMLVSGPPMRSTVTPSNDVILEGAPKPAAGRKFPLAVDGLVHVVLGDKVLVKASGIDAKLGGEMDLAMKGIDNITSSGEIRVVKGSYKAYGLDLDIVRGRIYYTKDPVTQPTLDILALRTVGDIKAGVIVAGYLRAPVIKLYSEPSMADVDVLAYMLLGHPLGTGTGSDQAGALAVAASGLLSFGQSESLQDQIKDRLGLSVLGLQTVTPSSAGLMGYKEIPVTPTGVPTKGATSESLLTVGKYLTPKLYVSYGRSLVTGGSLFMMRYDLSRHWQVETQSGSESGADLYYKLEFD